MITALDSNVLLDIFTNSPEHFEKSARALRSQLQSGSLVACGVVWAEVATFFAKPEDLRAAYLQAVTDFNSRFEGLCQRNRIERVLVDTRQDMGEVFVDYLNKRSLLNRGR